jgi:hypothetical protein
VILIVSGREQVELLQLCDVWENQNAESYKFGAKDVATTNILIEKERRR